MKGSTLLYLLLHSIKNPLSIRFGKSSIAAVKICHFEDLSDLRVSGLRTVNFTTISGKGLLLFQSPLNLNTAPFNTLLGYLPFNGLPLFQACPTLNLNPTLNPNPDLGAGVHKGLRRLLVVQDSFNPHPKLAEGVLLHLLLFQASFKPIKTC
jgi:hypothetical protein